MTWFGSDNLRRAKENAIEHFLGQFTRRCVLLARMVGTEQSRLQIIEHVMPEAEVGNTSDFPAALPSGEVSIHGDLSEHDDNAHISKQVEFAFEVRAAIPYLLWKRFVVGGRTVDRGSDPGIMQFKTISTASAFRLRCKASPIKRPVEEVTGTISGEHASSTIGPMCTRRQAKDQEPRRRITERRHGLTPIIPVEISTTLSRRDFVAVPDQTGAKLARYNLPLQSGKVLFVTFGDFK